MSRSLWSIDRAGALLALLVVACGAPEPRTPGEPDASRQDEEQGSVVATEDAAADSTALHPEDLSPTTEPAPELPEEIPPETAETESVEVDLGPDPLRLARRDAEPLPHFPLEMNERVEAWIHYFESVIPERFQLYLERLGRYESMLRQKLRQARLPEDLVYLSLIESGMSPNAVSRAQAVGMWQFISGTARMYDLEVSFWLDERRDPEKATDAAIAYLSDLYDQFGSWYLAAAAYNGGPGRIRRGLARENADTFWDLADAGALRSETTNYVPKIIAAAMVARDPDRYGFRAIERHEPLEFDLVTVPDATSFDVIAEASGTDLETIRELNPQYHRRATPPGQQVQIRVPAGAGSTFAANYAEIPPDERVTFTYHVIRRGETLGRIAIEYRTSVSALRAANGNLNPRRLRVGHRLVIPVVPGSRALTARASGNQGQDGPITVTVRRGDTLWALARRYAVTTREIMVWNELQSSTIKPGDRLTIRR